MALDPDDDVIAELALAAKADCVVTFNVRDLIPVKRFGIAVVTPAEFYSSIELSERMSTINVSDEAEEAAKSVNLSLSDFAQLALAQSLARTLKDPRLEELASRATGDGWERMKQFIPDAPPLPGDERP